MIDSSEIIEKDKVSDNSKNNSKNSKNKSMYSKKSYKRGGGVTIVTK
jgi:hypothetical protein